MNRIRLGRRLLPISRGILRTSLSPAVLPWRQLVFPETYPYFRPLSTLSEAALPRAVQPSFWKSLIPRFLLRSSSASSPRSKEWNPATFYIVIFMLIGSQSIQMITLRRESLNFNRQADAKISVLREVIRRVQNGEEVDVEGLLGTGNKEKEREWAELLQEIEEEDILWQSKSKKKPESKPETGEKNTSNEEAAQSKDSHVWI